ncbi:MAG: hypothetical protein E7648_08650 [Ruminococcaceae bacterium]|nr:hypothetical protein [Oscillospiraceae bacterium]
MKLTAIFLCIITISSCFFTGCKSNNKDGASITTEPPAVSTNPVEVTAPHEFSDSYDLLMMQLMAPYFSERNYRICPQFYDDMYHFGPDVLMDDEGPYARIHFETSKHISAYHHTSEIADTFVKYGILTVEDLKKDDLIFDKTDEWGIPDFIDYYGITREEYEKVWSLERKDNKYNPNFYESFNVNKYWNIWYADYYDYGNVEMFVHPDYDWPETRSVTRKYDNSHTRRYYTIDWRLIEYVTPERFKEYEKEFGGTENFNVIHFVNYFKIDKSEFLEIYPDIWKYYNPDYVYGTKEMQDMYFCPVRQGEGTPLPTDDMFPSLDDDAIS